MIRSAMKFFKIFSIMYTVMLMTGLTLLAQRNQELKLAQNYFARGEYAKALPIFEKLYDQQSASSYYYQNYFKCLVAMNSFKEAEKLVQKRMKKDKGNASALYVDLGYVHLVQDNTEKAGKNFDKAINLLGDNANQIKSIATAFLRVEVFPYALEAYLRGRKLLKNPKAFAYELALTHKKQGEYDKMMGAYLDYGIDQPDKLQHIKNELAKYLKVESNREFLEEELYRRIQREPDELNYNEMLVWLFIQQKDYESAAIQVKALDRRMNENGSRVFNLAQTAAMEGQHLAAIEAYEYVIKKDKFSRLYKPSRISVLDSKLSLVKEDAEDQPELIDLEAEYRSLLDEFGKNPSTASSMKSLAYLYAFHLHDLDKGIELLEEIVEMPSATPKLKAMSKLDLGDYYVLKGEIWEAALLYAQVDKAYKEDILGEEARFRNARLSYYNGDFSWAQTQLNVLKSATSELIANDALDLSVFIIDNLGLDTTETAMNMFARADLLIFQNKADDALQILDSLDHMFPGHMLADDILLRRANVSRMKRQYEQAIEYYSAIYEKFATDLLADDALFNMAEIYEVNLNKTDNAQHFYEELIINYPGSLFTVEARKRFRKLRGDTVN